LALIRKKAGLNVTNSVGAEFSGKIYMRKEQNDFGWDWSPAFGPAGPWKPAYAIQLSGAAPVYVQNALIDIYRQGQMNNLPPDQTKPFVFNASLDFFGDLPQGVSLSLELKDASNRTVVETPLQGVYHNNETITGHITIDSSLVQLWWPNGVGSQPLYYATVAIRNQHGQEVIAVERRVGFRTIILNLTPISEEQLSQGIAPGSNWHFEVNGHTIYAKGSNLTPPDVFWARVNETKIRQ
jgi:beta-mannosidase